MIPHPLERVISDITVQFDAGLDPPIPLELLHQRMLKKEAGLEPTHMPVALRISINNIPLSHVLPRPPSLVLVDEIWERPVLMGYLAVMGFAGYQGSCYRLEGVIERLVVQEDPIVMVISIESILNLSDRFDNFPQIRVAC